MSLFYFKITEIHIDEIEDESFALIGKVGNIFQPLQGLFIHLHFSFAVSIQRTPSMSAKELGVLAVL